MDQIIAHMDFWHWLILGVLMMTFELLFPGAFFIWMSVAAVITGSLLIPFPRLGWDVQIVIFAALSVISVVAWRWYLSKRPTRSDRPMLNRRGEQYIGRVLTLHEGIVNGSGKIKVDDSFWKVEGDDCPPGTRVHVMGVEGVILKVRQIKLTELP